jgi:hypothetical protein
VPALPQARHKSTKSGEAPHEPLDILGISDLAYFSDSQDFVRICFNATVGDDVPQEFASGDAEGAFFQIQPDVKASEVCKGFLQVIDEAIAMPSPYNDVINVDLQITPNLSLETGLHALLVGSPAFSNPNDIFT